MRAAVLAEATAKGMAMSEGMPNAAFFRGRVEAALAVVVGTPGPQGRAIAAAASAANGIAASFVGDIGTRSRTTAEPALAGPDS